MTSDAKNQAGYKTLEGGPIPLDEALFYAYPRDTYVWEHPSDGGSGTVGSRDFAYNTASGEVSIGFGGELGKSQQRTASKKQSQPSDINKTVYFKVQVGDSIQLIDRSERYQVIEKEVTFKVNSNDATVKLTVKDLG